MRVSGLCGLDAALRSVGRTKLVKLGVTGEELDRQITELFADIQAELDVPRVVERGPDDVDAAWGYGSNHHV